MRGSRGRSLLFYATDNELVEWFVESLPDLAPYSVFAEERSTANRPPVELQLETFAKWLPERHYGRLWLRSEVLSPTLEVAHESQLGLAGLIMIQPGRDWNRQREASAIGIVDHVLDPESGVVERHTEYLPIFERLRRSMRKRLVVETTVTYPDGSTGEGWRMTVRAAEEHRKGEITFDAAPTA